MNQFQVSVHVLPTDFRSGKTVEVDGLGVRTIQAAQASLSGPFGVTFEQVLEAFDSLPRMFAEPDGSFVWRGTAESGDWQLDGQLCDRDDRLIYVEMSGTVAEESLDLLLRILDWPKIALVFQLVRSGVLLDEAEFRRIVFA